MTEPFSTQSPAAAPTLFERIEALEALLSDYCVVIAERQVLRARLERIMRKAEARVAGLRTPPEHAAGIEVLRTFIEDRAYLDQELLVYRHYVADLRRRLGTAVRLPASRA